MASPVLLSTLNARYHHSAFGLRYLLANLGDIQSQASIREFTINQNPRDIAEVILEHNPRLLGLGVYIWNTRQTYDVVSLLKRIRPELKIVLGGPEVSFETESQPLTQLADLTIRGEAEFLFRDVARQFLATGELPTVKSLSGALPEIRDLIMPYELYSDEDVRHRVLYVEASRGCPYKCEYCLSSLDKSVRSFEIESFLNEMDRLIERGARQFKFVDRTFNLSISTSTRILNFFLERIDRGLFLHFEMVPDRLPIELRELICRFPAGSLQFEVGIQTWSPEVARLVSRRQDYTKIRENFAFLSHETGVHLHADLIAGLPGETLESFSRGFDAVAGLGPAEIQVGILKRLKGTPIVRHDSEWQMVYQEHPPFQILQTRTMSYGLIQRIGRFSHFWDLIANSGNFVETLGLLRELSLTREKASLYAEFDELSFFLSDRHPQGHSIALLNLLESVWIYLRDQRGVDSERLRLILIQDYAVKVKRDIPAFLRPEDQQPRKGMRGTESGSATATLPSRQQRHLNSKPLSVS